MTVVALKNGTQGWYLGDLPLDHGAQRRHPLSPPVTDLAPRREQAQALARRQGVEWVEAPRVRQWLDDASRSCFVLDVRTPEEFAQGSLPCAQSAPGGQLLQATDQYVGVRGARLVLADDDGVRAPVVASWLRQMGWEAFVLREGVRADIPGPIDAALDLPVLPTITAVDLGTRVHEGRVAVIDLRPSMDFRAGHIAGSRWAIRPRLGDVVRGLEPPVVLVADESGVARLAARDLHEAGVSSVSLLEGGLKAWKAAGMPVESSPTEPADADCIDYLFFVHDRHDGNKDAARRYLAWETGLLAQLDDDELRSFRIGAA